MPTSVRIDKRAQARLERLARITGRSKSDLMREAIARLDELLDGGAAPNLYDQWHDVIGIVNLGPGDRARRAEELLRRGFGRSGGEAPRQALGTRLRWRFARLGLSADIPELRSYPAAPAGFGIALVDPWAVPPR
jgi:hypothetical protein